LVNERDGYVLRLPRSWVGTVTVKEQTDTGEWRFYIYSDGKAQTELLRIKNVSPSEYQDKLETKDYRLLLEQGTGKLIYYIPNGDYPGFSVTDSEVKQMISFNVGAPMV
ncbi:MAG: hypothetical protein RRY40_02360, partial [Oscillospiraceae bacterium]